MDNPYYTEAQMAEMLGIKEKTLKARRAIAKNHPPFVKVGKSTLYPKNDFAQWVSTRPVRQEKAK